MNKLYRRIRDHGLIMVNHFGLTCDPVDLCKKLRRLENQSHGVMTQFCNGEIDSIQIEAYIEKLRDRLKKIFGEHVNKIKINQDPRGYCLKLTEQESLKVDGYKDWGGYFILAPDFKKEG